MSKPVEENWIWQDAPDASGHSGFIVFPDGANALIKYDPARHSQDVGRARGRIAAAAPEMGRLLLMLEWSDDGRLKRCPPYGMLMSALRKAGLVT